jgi:hypothetical protein
MSTFRKDEDQDFFFLRNMEEESKFFVQLFGNKVSLPIKISGPKKNEVSEEFRELQ